MSDAPHFRSLPPDKTAIVMGFGEETITFGQLEAEANRGARAFEAMGLGPGDALAVCIANMPEFFFVVCAARRCGLTVVPISTRLTAGELAFIVNDSGAKAVVLSLEIEATRAQLQPLCPGVPILLAGAGSGNGSWEAACASQRAAPLVREVRGREMLYSSGTTGRPKGIVYETLAGTSERRDATSAMKTILERFGLDSSAVYLCPAPLYHSAPYAWTLGILESGGTVVIMEYFDAERALALIDRCRVTVAQWVPTHFVRLLKLADPVRKRYDTSSLRVAVHAAAPCPIAVKRAMIEWWGPILLEYFGSSEQTALTFISSEEWLAHPGSVGKCVLGNLHICDDEGRPLAPGEVGTIYSEHGTAFSYHNDPGKTAGSKNALGWTTVGDIGRLDEEGYLYLTDRKSFMIITGGVNVYPQEIENRLVLHPKVFDAAVIGLPDEDLGEAVTAVVQPVDGYEGSASLADELRTWMRLELSGVKVPRHILFRTDLPRLPTGKMAKHKLREELVREPHRAVAP